MDLTVTIVRHGNTFDAGDVVRRIGVRTDLRLVAKGCEQADALGRAFAEQGLAFDRALAAPLLRTRETIDRILAYHPAAPEIESADWLTEIDHGPDEDRSEEAVIARIGSQALDAWDRDARVPDGWIVNAEERLKAWRDFWESSSGRVLIVTSNGAARFALFADPALRAQASTLPSLKLRTGAYGVIVREAGALRLLAWDQRS